VTVIYKICARAEWAEALASGSYTGSEHDRRDGFIHFSTASQLVGTLAKHFARRPDLVLIAADAEAFGGALRWEPARDGDLFPHLYGPMPVAAALWTRDLALGPSGEHRLPPEALA
jgi:uncharacterized protein (DUF952 family)